MPSVVYSYNKHLVPEKEKYASFRSQSKGILSIKKFHHFTRRNMPEGSARQSLLYVKSTVRN